MSAASRAKAAEKERQSILALLDTNRVKLAEWLAANTDPFATAARLESTARVFVEGQKIEPIPHWVLPLGEPLVDPDYFSPPTAEINGKLAPVLSVRAFHHSLDPILGVTFERATLGAPWVRTA